MVALVVGVVLLMIELFKSLPANLRVHRARSADGHSEVSLGLLLGVAPGWILFGVLSHAPAVAVACAVWSVLHLLLCVQVAALRPAKMRRLWLSALSTAAVLTILVMVGSLTSQAENAVGLAIALSTLVYGWPALLVGMRSSTTSGLSSMSLAMKTAEGGVYLLAGLGLGLLAPSGHFVLGFASFGVLAIVCNAPVLARTLHRRATGADRLQLVPA